MQAEKTCAHNLPVRQSASACHKAILNNRAVEEQTTRTSRVPSLGVSAGLDLGIMARKPEQLPDPWLFDSEKLLNELGRTGELIDQIPIARIRTPHTSRSTGLPKRLTTCANIYGSCCTCTESNNAASDANMKKTLPTYPCPDRATKTSYAFTRRPQAIVKSPTTSTVASTPRARDSRSGGALRPLHHPKSLDPSATSRHVRRRLVFRSYHKISGQSHPNRTR